MASDMQNQQNMFLNTPLGSLFAKTAAPIIFVMMTNGLFTVVDGWYIGQFVGADAFSAVTMVFPLFMMLIALGTLVSSGFSSVLARLLGAGRREEGEQAMVSALLLSILICALLIILFLLFGNDLIEMIANGSKSLSVLGYEYLSLVIFFSPLFFLAAMLADSFRCQGKLIPMTIITLLSTVLNILFNYILMVEFEMGVAGSAYGTALAQAGSIVAALLYQYSNTGCLTFKLHSFSGLWQNWGKYLALGAPISLNYIGVSIISGSVIYQLQIWDEDTYEISVAAYGIITRVLTFGYMPLLGLTLAQQTIVGNNFGAGNWLRTFKSLKICVAISAVYCGILQIFFILLPSQIGGIFVDDPLVIAETARLLPKLSMLYILFGPLLMFPSFFQSIGDAKRSALLGLTKTYLISVPLILLLPQFVGEVGIWYASPVTEVIALLLTLAVLYRTLFSTDRATRFLKAQG
ncbi:MAG: MATE family efflux transporter [Sneathiella sp.]